MSNNASNLRCILTLLIVGLLSLWTVQAMAQDEPTLPDPGVTEPVLPAPRPAREA